ncbi:hypothetical protein [Teredinibacter franksiae]|uniref:hypothetical protein n=1 Tax=Teredinibacter franksiae TaxID=2761453 RepID=UPI00162A8B40|nr:hypothetical protein [Teredinibacter franksiae]
MYKIVGIVVLLVVGYLLFFRESLPEVIYFNGNEYGSRQLDRSNDSNSKIYKYFSRSVSNNDYISVLYPDSGTGSPSEWSNMFAKHFERQGFIFSDNGVNKIGVNKTVKIYMLPSSEKNVVFMYVLENIENSKHLDESKVFDHLEAVLLD